jgi:hypothetical protein
VSLDCIRRRMDSRAGETVDSVTFLSDWLRCEGIGEGEWGTHAAVVSPRAVGK